jgi:hypothetical protein
VAGRVEGLPSNEEQKISSQAATKQAAGTAESKETNNRSTTEYYEPVSPWHGGWAGDLKTA